MDSIGHDDCIYITLNWWWGFKGDVKGLKDCGRASEEVVSVAGDQEGLRNDGEILGWEWAGRGKNHKSNEGTA